MRRLDLASAIAGDPELWTTVAGQSGILLSWALLGILVVREHYRWEPRGCPP